MAPSCSGSISGPHPHCRFLNTRYKKPQQASVVRPWLELAMMWVSKAVPKLPGSGGWEDSKNISEPVWAPLAERRRGRD